MEYKKNNDIWKLEYNGYVYLIINVLVGSFNEKEDERGLAHFIEHMNMCFRKYRFYKSEIIRAYAITDYYSTTYFIKTELDNIEKAFCIADSIRKGNYIKEEYIEAIRKDILNELLEKEHEIENIIMQEVLSKTKYKGKEAIGRREFIQTYTIEKIREFYNKWYIEKNIKIGWIGNFDEKNIRKIENEWIIHSLQNKAEADCIVTDWKACSIQISEKNNRVRFIYPIYVKQMTKLLRNEYTLYEFCIDAVSELLETFFKSKTIFQDTECENRLLSREEDIWWIDFSNQELGETEIKEIWHRERKNFLVWLSEEWNNICSKYKKLIIEYENYMTEEYLVYRYREAVIYKRKFLNINQQKSIIHNFLIQDSKKTFIELASVILNNNEMITVNYARGW